MHEIGIVRSMCKTVLDYAKANNVQQISEIVCEVGELSLVIPEYVEELYPAVAAETPLKDTKLILEHRPRHGGMRRVRRDIQCCRERGLLPQLRQL